MPSAVNRVQTEEQVRAVTDEARERREVFGCRDARVALDGKLRVGRALDVSEYAAHQLVKLRG
jgi:hypothetical protein